MTIGTTMLLDISTLYLAATMVAALLGALLLFFWQQEKIAALGWWGAAYLLGGASIALWTMGGPALGYWLSLAINAVGFMACGLVWDAARVFHGRAPSLIGMVAGSIVWVVAMLAMEPMTPDVRMMLGATIVAAYAALTANELGRERRKSLRARWPTIVVPVLHGGVLMLPIVFGNALGDSLGGAGAVWIAVFAAELVLYAVGTVFIIFMLVSERTVSAHKSAASRDPLTGLFNRRGFSEATSRMIERQAKAGQPVTVMVFDIDHFKSVNDRFGHFAGDEVLKVFANIAMTSLRVTDLVGRVGGEEFAALLPCEIDEALNAAERVREAFQESGIAVDGAPLETTVSIGLASGPADTDLEVLMVSADTALYQAKRSGRNRIEVAEEPLSPIRALRPRYSDASPAAQPPVSVALA